jgi:hypothetical protein
VRRAGFTALLSMLSMLAGCANSVTREGVDEPASGGSGASAQTAPQDAGARENGPSLAAVETLRGTFAPPPLTAEDAKDKLRISRPIVRPMLRPPMIRALAQARQPVLRACFTHAPDAPSDHPTGRYVLEFDVTPEGTVSNASFTTSPTGVPSEVLSCALAEVSSWRFAATAFLAHVRYPLDVRAGD